MLAVESLKSLSISRCISHPQYDPESDMPAKRLTQVLLNTDKLLRRLEQHLWGLVGNSPTGNWALSDWIGYQHRIKDLPDPIDIIDGKEMVADWLTKIQYKLATLPKLPHLPPPVPQGGTITQEPDNPSPTPADLLHPPVPVVVVTEDGDGVISVANKSGHPDELLFDDPTLPLLNHCPPQCGVDNLPDPIDIIDNRETVAESHPSPPVRQGGTIAQEPDSLPPHTSRRPAPSSARYSCNRGW